MATSKSSSRNTGASSGASSGATERAATSADPDTRTDAPSYEQARDELVEVVRRLEAGGTTLEESLSLWERGEELARICQSWLQGARERLERAERTDHHETSNADDDAEER